MSAKESDIVTHASVPYSIAYADPGEAMYNTIKSCSGSAVIAL